MMNLSALIKPKITVRDYRYSVLESIGEGAFAFVYRVKSLNKIDINCHYALKKIICQSEEQLAEAHTEIDVLCKINHPNVLKLLVSDIAKNKKGQDEVFMVLPLMLGTVQQYITGGLGYPHCAIQNKDIIKIFQNCADGLSVIHSHGYRHADFKAANVLLNENHDAVITDLGSALPLTSVVTQRSEALMLQEQAARLTTASIRAPELFDTPSHCIIDGKSDVWSFGCFIFAVLFSRTPFENPHDGLSILAVISGHYSIPENHPWPKGFVDLIAHCLQVNMDQRCCITEVQSRVHSLDPLPSEWLSTTTSAGQQIAEKHHFELHKQGPSSKLTVNSESFANFDNVSIPLCQNLSGHSQGLAKDVSATVSATMEQSESGNGLCEGASSQADEFGDFESASNFDALWLARSTSPVEREPRFQSITSDVGSKEEGRAVSIMQTSEVDGSTDLDFGDFESAELQSQLKPQAGVGVNVGTVAGVNVGTVAGVGDTWVSPSEVVPEQTSDLLQNILADCRNAGTGTSIGTGIGGIGDCLAVLKQGAVFIMRPRGLMMKITKKKVWMVLTRSGLVVRKDSDANSKIHHMLSLHHPISLHVTDTLAIGLNGMLVSGSTPSAFMSNIDSTEGRDMAVVGADRGATAVGAYSWEMSFVDKDDLSDWMDAVHQQVQLLKESR